MNYPNEMYEDIRRKEAKWARQDANKAIIFANRAISKGEHRSAERFKSFAYQKTLEAEFHESQI